MEKPDSLLLFYRPPVIGSGIPDEPGVAVTGVLDADGNYVNLQIHPGFDFWLDVVPADPARGLVLFHALSLSRTTVGRVEADGSYVDVRNQIDVPPSHAIFSMRDGTLIFYRTVSEGGGVVGFAVTGRLDDSGNLVLLSEPRRLDFWSHVVHAADGLVLFYRGDGAAATGRIVDGALQELKSFTGFDPWTHVVATSDGMLLFYNAGTGAAVTGRLDPDGNYGDLRNLALDPGWKTIVPTTNGLVLFYRTTPSGAEAVVGQIDDQGAFADRSLINGLERWTRIVSVRST